MESDIFLAAKQGDSEALSQLFYRYRPIIFHARNKYFLRELDYQDWMQEGWIVLYQCIQNFEPGFGTTFGTFFKRAFENRITSLLRKEQAYKRKTNIYKVSLEQSVLQEESEGFAVNYLNTPLDKVVVRETLAECTNLLTPLEKEALAMYGLGEMDENKVSERRYKNAYIRSKKKVRQHLQQAMLDQE